MSRHAWLTPDSIPDDTLCRVLRIPNDINIRGAVSGALLDLALERNWEQFGDVTPEDLALAMLTMLENFWDSEQENCMPQVWPDIFYDEHTQGTDGGGITANNNTSVAFTQAASQNPGAVVLSSGSFVLSEGKYYVEIEHTLRNDVAAISRAWLAGSSFAVLIEGSQYNEPTNVPGLHRVVGYYDTPAGGITATLALRSNDTRATDALGFAANITGHVERYGVAQFWRIGDL